MGVTKICTKCNLEKLLRGFTKDVSSKGGIKNICISCDREIKNKEAICGIYKITSPEDKTYIGQAVDIAARWKNYRLMAGFKTESKLYNSLIGYEVENHTFEIIEECPEEELNMRERYWQDFYDATGKNGLNCILTIESSKSGRLSKSIIELSVNRYGNKEKMLDVIDIEAGVFYNSVREASNYSFINKNAFRDMLKGRYLNKTSCIKSEDYEKGLLPNMLFTPKDVKRPSKKVKLINPQTGKIYNSIKEFSNEYGIPYNIVLNCIKGVTKTTILPVVTLEEYNKKWK